jgi:hypothetical protein
MVRQFKIQSDSDISKKSQFYLHQSLRTPVSQGAQLHLVLNQPNWNQTEWTNLKNGISLNSENSASYMPQQLWILGMVRTISRTCIIFLMQMIFHETKTQAIKLCLFICKKFQIKIVKWVFTSQSTRTYNENMRHVGQHETKFQSWDQAQNFHKENK